MRKDKCINIHYLSNINVKKYFKCLKVFFYILTFYLLFFTLVNSNYIMIKDLSCKETDSAH